MIGRKFRETMNKLNILLPLVLCLINFICICFTYRISPICTLMLLLCQISFFFSGTLYYFTHKKAMQKIFKDLLIYMDHQSCITCLFLQTMHKCILHKRLQCQRKDPRLHVHIRVDRQFRRKSVSKPKEINYNPLYLISLTKLKLL